MAPYAENTKEKIVDKLIADGRISFRSIAKELHISTTTVSKIVKELEEKDIIKGFHASIDWQKIGFDSALCLQIISMPNANIDRVGETLKNLPPVRQVFYTTGDTTFSAYAVCKTSEEARDILENIASIEGVERVVSHTILKIY